MRKRFFREALLQIFIPYMLKQLSPSCASVSILSPKTWKSIQTCIFISMLVGCICVLSNCTQCLFSLTLDKVHELDILHVNVWNYVEVRWLNIFDRLILSTSGATSLSRADLWRFFPFHPGGEHLWGGGAAVCHEGHHDGSVFCTVTHVVCLYTYRGIIEGIRMLLFIYMGMCMHEGQCCQK